MEIDYSKKLKTTTKQILNGSFDEKISEYYKYNNDKFLYAFYYYMLLKYSNIEYIDEIKYSETEDKIAYLEDTQNVRIRKTVLEDDWYKNDYGDFIGFLEKDDEPVIIKKALINYYIIVPNTNKYIKINKKTVKKIKNEGVFISKLLDKSEKNGLKVLLKYILSERAEILKFLFYSILASLTTIAITNITSEIINEYIADQDIKTIIVSCNGMILFILAGFLINIIVTRVKVKVQTKVGAKTFSGLLYRLMHIPVNEEKNIAYKLISLIIQYNNAIDTITGSIVSIVIYFVQCLFIFLQINALEFNNKGFMYSLMVVFLFIISFIQIKIFNTIKIKQNYDNDITKFQNEVLSSEETIKNNAIETIIDYLFTLKYHSYNSNNTALENYNQYNSIIINVFNNLFIFFVFFISYYSIDDQFNGSPLIVILFPLLTSYLFNLINALSETFKSIPYIDFATMILDKPVEKNGIEGIRKNITGEIELSHINFSYPGSDREIFKDLNLKIKPGEHIGIVGGSGCGKSTLIKLLLGFEQPVSGAIYYDGVRFDAYNVMDIRRQIGVCLQKPEVITASIKTNIAMTDDADMDKVREAAKGACILDEIEEMPMKFETILISEANTISGGQKQRIVLARALMNNPKILILDEATSAIDNVTQQKIKESLEKLGITCISIAHRLSTIENCDRILYIDKGEIVEEGSFKELMEKGGLFAKMARRNII